MMRLMRKMILLLALGGLSVQAGLSKLEALSMIESGDNDRAVGRTGEVSRYQIRPQVWALYSQSASYANAKISSWVAEQHLNYLEGLFRANTGREPTDFDRYVLWNAGISYYARVGFSPGAVSPVIRERAQRYVNLREMEEAKAAPAGPSTLVLGPKAEPKPHGN